MALGSYPISSLPLLLKTKTSILSGNLGLHVSLLLMFGSTSLISVLWSEWSVQPYSDHSPDFCRDMWLRKSCGLRPQENYGFLWLQRCCCLWQQPTVAASGRKSLRSSQWATEKMASLTIRGLVCNLVGILLDGDSL